MAFSKTDNRHHGIPRSCGGSNVEGNLSPVLKYRHDAFHVWAENRLPCQNTRMIAIHGIGKEEESLHPETVDTLFQITTVRNVSRLYYDRTFRSIASINAVQHAKDTDHSIGIRLTEEKLILEKTIEALKGYGHFPSDDMRFLDRALHFFQTESPRDALKSFYCESAFGSLSWVKPMLHETRRSILQVLQWDEKLPYRSPAPKRMIPVLEKQLRFIEGYEHDRKRRGRRNKGK